MFNWRDRLKAFAIHLSVSLFVALLASLLVFVVWYPYPYREISGGRELFLIVVSVDVVLGPLLTFSVFDRRKPKNHIFFDLCVIGLFQLAALGYGLWTVFVARPVHLVFEYDRFRVVHAIEVPEALLSKTPLGINPLPLTGPTILSIRRASGSEVADVAMAELNGAPACARPDFWQPYSAARQDVLQHAKAISELKVRFPASIRLIEEGVVATGRRAEDLRYLPLYGRKKLWTVFVDSNTTEVLTVIPLDPY